jgi:hypothetical protein
MDRTTGSHTQHVDAIHGAFGIVVAYAISNRVRLVVVVVLVVVLHRLLDDKK